MSTCQRISREKLYTPRPLPPTFWARRHFSGRGGGGLHILKPPRQEFYTPPFFLNYTPPTPRGVFSGVGGWGCIKFGPVQHVRNPARNARCRNAIHTPPFHTGPLLLGNIFHMLTVLLERTLDDSFGNFE